MCEHCQQDRLYEAEMFCPRGRLLESAEAIQTYVDELRDKFPRWHTDFAMVSRVEAYTRKKGVSSVGSYVESHHAGLIEMSHREELFVLHETAHVLAEARYGSRSHDPWFARVYLELVYCAMGSAAYLSLRQSFEALGVDCDHDDAGLAGPIRV